MILVEEPDQLEPDQVSVRIELAAGRCCSAWRCLERVASFSEGIRRRDLPLWIRHPRDTDFGFLHVVAWRARLEF